MTKIVSKKPSEDGRVKIRVSADGRRYSVWVLPAGLIRNPVTGFYEQIFIGEPCERLVRTFVGDKIVSEVIQMVPQTYLVPVAVLVKAKSATSVTA